jgi:hypothetical protein
MTEQLLDNSSRQFKYSKTTSLGGVGTQTAALAFGGATPPGTGATEEYNGTTWATSPASLNTARFAVGAAGIQTAALGFGGTNTTYYSSNRRI